MTNEMKPDHQLMHHRHLRKPPVGPRKYQIICNNGSDPFKLVVVYSVFTEELVIAHP
jgi:hypothetical protein